MKSREERIEHIKKACEAVKNEKSPSTYPIKYWRGGKLQRNIILVDADNLMFRIENSRTDIQQSAYIKRKSLPESTFQDPESFAAQTAQREILLEMINSKGKDLYEDLRNHKQDDPCIITYDGYLVNGNRRTAVLKDLNVRHIECVVLPENAEAKDIYALEQQLQISQDFKEDYHWINELKNIRRGKREFKFTDIELTNNLRLSGVPELKTKIRTLDLIDAFLLWKNTPGEYDYSKLDDTEEIFRQLEKATKKYGKDATKREKLQNAVFTLIEHRPTAGRLYGHVMSLIKDFDKVYAKAAQDESSIDDAPPPYGTVSSTDSGLLFELADNNSTPDIFSDPENAAENADKLMEAIEDVKAENKEKRDTEAVYEGVSAALRELQGLVIDQDTAKLNTVINKLNEIIKISTQLLRDTEKQNKR
jgi:hypothetical protein